MLAGAVRSLVVPAALDDPAFADRATTGALGIGAYTGVPLRTVDGAIYGTLCTLHPVARTPAAGEVAVMGLAGRLIMQAVEADRRLAREASQARALRKATERLHTIYGAMACGVLVVDGDGLLVEINDAACGILGTTFDATRGHSLSKAPWRLLDSDGLLLPPEHYPSMRTLRTGQPQRAVPMRVRRADGEVRWLHVDVVPVPAATGDGLWAVVSFVDTTRAHEAEEALATSEARFRALTLYASDLVCVLGPIGEVRYESPSYARLLGEPLAGIRERLGTTLAIVHPDDRAAVAGTFGRLQAPGASATIEWRLRAADGSWHTFECIAANRTDDPSVAGIVLTNRDVSVRKAAEVAMRTSEAGLRQLVAAAPIGMAISTPEGIFEEVNASYGANFGYAREELIGRPVATVLAPESRAEAASALARRTEEDARDLGEWAVVTKNGERRTVLASGLTVLWTDGAPRRVSFTIDITERKQAERRLAELAHYDRLTGLPNRALFTERLHAALSQAQERDDVVALLFVDLDGFKAANDAYGHGIGDMLLQVAAERLAGCVREGDTVARLGGDEFTAILPGIGDADTAARVAAKMLATLAEPFCLDGQEVRVSGSIGVAVSPVNGTEPSALLAAADGAMYEAKRAGKHRFVLAQ